MGVPLSGHPGVSFTVSLLPGGEALVVLLSGPGWSAKAIWGPGILGGGWRPLPAPLRLERDEGFGLAHALSMRAPPGEEGRGVSKDAADAVGDPVPLILALRVMSS